MPVKFAAAVPRARQILSAIRGQIRFHWPFVILFVLFASFLFTMMTIIPPGDGSAKDASITAPDENAHFLFNVKFIADNDRLPVSGKDDLLAYKICSPHHVGLAPCVYSYTVYPGPNYVISAAFIKAARLVHIHSSYRLARITSVFSGLVFAICSYAAAYMIMRRRSYATVLTAAIICIPQFIFTLSYTNLDAYAAGVSALLGLSMVGFMQNPHSRKWQLAVSITLFGLLPATKYNYFVLGAGALALIGYTLHRTRLSRQEVRRFAIYAGLSFLVLASFWYVRNLILYHDPLGQSFMIHTMAQHSALGKPYPQGWSGFNIALQRGFFSTLFQSFFFALGLMHLYLSPSAYALIGLLLLGCVMVLLYNATQPSKQHRDGRQQLLAALLFIVIGIAAIAVVLFNSLMYDFQPQGRYMYPILVPTVLLISFMIRRDKRNGVIPYILLLGTAFMFINFVGVVVRAYLPVIF
jgi:hypothetical protein